MELIVDSLSTRRKEEVIKMYILVNNGVAASYSITQLKKDNPNTSFPKEPTEELLATYGVYICTNEPQPDYDESIERLILGDPVLVDGSWVRKWTTVPIPEEELALSVRNERDRLLTESDWTQVSDSPLFQDSAWLSYRTELRDITDQDGFPYSVVWPVIPQS